MLAVVAVALAATSCYPGDETRHAMGVVITGATESDVNIGKSMLAEASAVTVREFNMQLVLVGEVVDATIANVPCFANADSINTGLLLTNKEPFGGIHVNMVSHCPEPSKAGGFVRAGDRVCAGHTALYVGRSNYITLLHELGHLLSGSHPGGVAEPVCSVGGIMDYCNNDPHPYGTYNGIVQFHPEQKAKICNHLSADTACLYNPAEVLPHLEYHHHHSYVYIYVAVGLSAMLALTSLFVIWYVDTAQATLM
ncbi:MAG: hypothetical protein ACPGR8_01190 [Limisphaerales bacterium]